MLDLRFIRENSEEVKRSLRNRNLEPELIDQVLHLDDQRRTTLKEAEALRAKHNVASKEIGRQKGSQGAPKLNEEIRQLSDKIKNYDSELRDIDSQLEALLLTIPNVPDASVPVGPDSKSNIEVRKWGELPHFDFEPKPHWEIGEALGILDMERGAKLSGSRFPMIKGLGDKLERALISFMLDLHTNEHGYTSYSLPYLVRPETMQGSGNLPKFKDELYLCPGKKPQDDLYLIPTAEVVLVNIHMDEVLDASQLPLKETAHTACFRREAGAAGRDEKGLIRVHQFHKVELVKICNEETSFQELETMVKDAEEVLQRLKLPYRVVLLSTGDMGFAAAKTYDLEVWLPSQNTYREISSCSNCTDFQARRGNIKYRPAPDQRPRFVHGLNGSGIAVGRTFLAILENYQQTDGTVVIPEALRPYMGGLDAIRPPSK